MFQRRCCSCVHFKTPSNVTTDLSVKTLPSVQTECISLTLVVFVVLFSSSTRMLHSTVHRGFVQHFWLHLNRLGGIFHFCRRRWIRLQRNKINTASWLACSLPFFSLCSIGKLQIMSTTTQQGNYIVSNCKVFDVYARNTQSVPPDSFKNSVALDIPSRSL